MRRSGTLLLASIAALACVASVVLVACEPAEAAAADVCAQAKNRFESCGASLPLLEDGPCTGTTRIVARCVADHARDCDELATLSTRIDACLADMLDGGDHLLPPATDLPAPGRDGGKGRFDAADDGAAAPPRDAASDGPGVDGALGWPGLDANGTVLRGEERHFRTPSLPAGSYRFVLNGTGDADLYVRKAAAPTTTTYDCRPFEPDSSESCTVVLVAPEPIFVMVRGSAATSMFTLEGRP